MPSKIEWTDDTRNWQSGCTEARRGDGTMDPACVHCYARLMSARLGAMGLRLYDGAATRSGNVAKWTGKLTWDRDILGRHMAELRPGKITFVGSMTDLFHADADPAMWEAWAEAARRVSALPRKEQPRGMVTLTKRADRLLLFQRTYFPEGLPRWWWPGVTVADDRGAYERMGSLTQLLAYGPKVVSYEPAMGPVEFGAYMRLGAIHSSLGVAQCGIGWLIAGGESGPKARPSHPDWFRAARDAAVSAGVPFHFKQWGEWAPWFNEEDFTHGGPERRAHLWLDAAGNRGDAWLYDADGTWQNWTGEPPKDMSRVATFSRPGKKAAGRVLDGRTWDEVPA